MGVGNWQSLEIRGEMLRHPLRACIQYYSMYLQTQAIVKVRMCTDRTEDITDPDSGLKTP